MTIDKRFVCWNPSLYNVRIFSFISTSDLELIFHKYLIYVFLKESPLRVINKQQTTNNQSGDGGMRKKHI